MHSFEVQYSVFKQLIMYQKEILVIFRACNSNKLLSELYQPRYNLRALCLVHQMVQSRILFGVPVESPEEFCIPTLNRIFTFGNKETDVVIILTVDWFFTTIFHFDWLCYPRGTNNGALHSSVR